MEKFIRLEIIAVDRIGITLEFLEKIHKLNINLISVEVFTGRVCVKIEDIHQDKIEELKMSIFSIEGVFQINRIELLDHEKSQRKLLAIIDSIDEGIMYINEKSEVEIFNSYCENVFYYSKEDILEKNINKLIKNEPMVELLKSGKKHDNIEVNFQNGRGRSHYLATVRPVKDDNDNNIGVVASIRDMDKAIEIANVVSSSNNGIFNNIIGNSLGIERVKGMIKAVAKSNSTVILRGESGTGKELFAKAVHNLSSRKDKKFIPVNCAALPNNLIESELFGYEKGSFTGAFATKEGLFKEAHEGTLFLDEVGELPLLLQAKLLRVLQEGVVRRIGSNIEESIDVRIVCATNRNLEEMVKEGKFREDLYYRLNVIPVYIPPLREHLEDIPSLVRFFIEDLNKKISKRILGTDLEFINNLMKYNWPGNVRELRNVVERAMNICNDKLLKAEHLIINFNDNLPMAHNILEEENLKLNEIMEITEKEVIIKALRKNKTLRKSAKALGVSHTTVINKINKYGIEWKE
ncbi:sigma 54-interacting transcriptional regulator [Clostridium malenominatum]|uniref:HTH-type transcriptional regulatory protein TyrR n=1 Tax=Clostridium malenominatum TaxID=1539 RepID=A0ABN1J669_9CLOT